MQRYKIVWDREATLLTDMNRKFAHIHGFAGVVLSSKGLGARFTEASYQDARQKSGLAVGVAYQINGIPVENSEQDTVALMGDCQWPVQVVPGSRKVKGRMAQIKVRAASPPPREVLRVTCDREIYTLHIQEQTGNPTKQKKPEAPQPDNRTWADAVRTSLGRERVTQAASQQTGGQASNVRAAHPPPQPQRPQHQQANRKRAQWADQTDEEEMSMSSEPISDSEDSFVPWNLFEEPPVEHVDPTADQYVEGGPKKKIRKTSKRASGHQKGRTLRTLEQGLMAVQAQMSELVGALSQQHVVHMRTGPQRGTMP